MKECIQKSEGILIKEISETSIKEKIEDNRHHSVLVICAHSDDQIFGPGATLAKLAKQGAKITTVILSFGELTPFWLKSKYTVKARVDEANKVNKYIGGGKVMFLGLKEGRFGKEAEKKGTYEVLKKIIDREKPSLVFTHKDHDWFIPDHKATLNIVKKTIPMCKHKPEVYAFGVWVPIRTKTRAPRLFVDVSNTFKKKTKALFMFKSQRFVVLELFPFVYFNSRYHGLVHGCKHAEVFRRIFID